MLPTAAHGDGLGGGGLASASAAFGAGTGAGGDCVAAQTKVPLVYAYSPLAHAPAAAPHAGAAPVYSVYSVHEAPAQPAAHTHCQPPAAAL